MSDAAYEKKHLPTQKRLSELKKEGTSLRSKDLLSSLIIMGAFLVIMYFAPIAGREIFILFKHSFMHLPEVITNPDYIQTVLINADWKIFISLLPIFISTLCIIFLSPFLFGGWNFSLSVIQFKLTSLNPLNNLLNLISKRMVLNVLLSLTKVIVIGSLFCSFLYWNKHKLFNLVNLTHAQIIRESFTLAKQFLIVIMLALVLVVMIDLLYRFYEFRFRHMMSDEEVKDEHKESEGNSDVKRKVRSMQISLLRQRIATAVPSATVIVTNPTHYAIAIRYDRSKDKAPKVVAKGKDALAMRIRQLALQHRVPLYEAPVLARALYRTTKINSEVHPDLYVAIALILTYVNQLKSYQHGIGAIPQKAADLQIPRAFIFKE